MVARPGTEQSQGSGQAPSIGGTVWYNIVGWVRQESAATTALVQAFIALGIAFEWWHWSPAQTGAVVGIVAALLGMFVRSQVTPIHKFRPKTRHHGASGRGMSNGPQGDLDSEVRVLPETGAGPAGGPDAGTAGGPPPGAAPGMAGGPPTGPGAGMPGGPPSGPGAGQAPRPNTGPPGMPPTRPDAGPPTRPDVPPDFPERGYRQ
jgi:hypothetical protein